MSEICTFLTPIVISIQLFLNDLAGVFGFIGYRAPDLLSPLTFLFGCTIS